MFEGMSDADAAAKLRAENDRLRAALAWYADPATYDYIGPNNTVTGAAWRLRDDMGQRARDALKAP